MAPKADEINLAEIAMSQPPLFAAAQMKFDFIEIDLVHLQHMFPNYPVLLSLSFLLSLLQQVIHLSFDSIHLSFGSQSDFELLVHLGINDNYHLATSGDDDYYNRKSRKIPKKKASN